MLDERKRKSFDAIVWSASLAFAAVFPATAGAGGHRYANDNAAYRAECGSCHIPYPPALLGADAWRGIMQGLDRHFGTDASLGAKQSAELAAYLDAAAGSRKVAGAPRITEAGWFRKEHAEVPASTWKSTMVKSAANCEACHRQASTGDFSERNIRMPRQEAR